ncbi:hypothetical protein [Halorussus salinus]|uniref:hypothetical protein n=1 Tax=Halorussus salinus TaxID=1364935 RepID=UPI00109322AE|nr:hypothetical protein [Halorussus salinus]
MAVSTTGDAATVDARDRRAAEEAMTVTPFGPAMFEVYTTDSVYRVDIRDGRCTCDDYRHREPDGGCKHIRRVLFAIGARDIPAGVDVDYVLRTRPAVTEGGER